MTSSPTVEQHELVESYRRFSCLLTFFGPHSTGLPKKDSCHSLFCRYHLCSSQTECHSSVTPCQISSFNKRCAGNHAKKKTCWKCLIFPAEDTVRKKIVLSQFMCLSRIRASFFCSPCRPMYMISTMVWLLCRVSDKK